MCIRDSTWTVDTTPPDTTLTATPPNPSSSADAAFGFTGSDSSAGVARFECQLDSDAWATCVSPRTYSGLSEGDHTFRVRAIDGAGNSDATPAEHTWTIALPQPPDTTLTSAPPVLSNSATASFTFSSNASSSTFECQLDSAPFAACTTPTSYSGLTDGSQMCIRDSGHFTCALRADGGVDCWGINPDGRADDQAGPFGPTALDAFAPDTLIDSGPDNPTEATGATFTFRGNEYGATFACSLDGGAYAACASSQSYSGLAVGAHTFRVRATDLAGNADTTPAEHAWTINALTPPETTIDSGPPDLTNSTSAAFTFSSSKSGTFQCTLDSAAYAACTSPKSYTGLAGGPHTFTVKAIDSGGTEDPTPASRTWTVDTSAPDTTLVSTPANPSTSSDASFAFSSEAGATFECKLDGGAFAACASPKSYTGLSDGSHTFQALSLIHI